MDRRSIDLTEEELIQKIVERINVARKRYTNFKWEFGKDSLHNIFHFSECIELKKGCKVEKLLDAAAEHRKGYKAKTDDGFVSQMHSLESDGDYSYMFYFDKLLEARNPITDVCPTCNQKIPGVAQSAVKTFLND